MATNAVVYDNDLNPLLAKASKEELDPLVGYILNKGKRTNSLKKNKLYQTHQPDHTRYPEIIAKEIRLYGGHTLINRLRGRGPSYKEVVMDVADRLKAGYEKSWSIAQIELQILMAFSEQAWEKMNEEEKVLFLNSLGVSDQPNAETKSLQTWHLAHEVYNQHSKSN